MDRQLSEAEENERGSKMRVENKTIERVVTETRTLYVANDGTEFKGEAECRKYEETCLCVVNSDYVKLVVGTITEEELFPCGSWEYSYDIVEIDTAEDAEIVCKRIAVLSHTYKGVFDKIRKAVGGYLLVARDYDGDIDGYVTTLEEQIKGMQNAMQTAIERGIEK